MAIQLNGKRILLWDTDILEEYQGISIRSHKPSRKNVALRCDDMWEGRTCGYPTVMKYGDEYRLYYRASGLGSISSTSGDECFCLATSRDGKVFEKKPLHIYESGGSYENNIIHMEERFVDNFSIHYDDNPDCPENEKFKALSMVFIREPEVKTLLAYYTSPDGIHFTYQRILDVKGVFDSHNVLLYDNKNKLYRLYLRDFHHRDGSDVFYVPDDAVMKPCIRDVRLSTSQDLITWSAPVKLNYGDEDLIQMYTSQIIKYPRADVYFGIPTRYKDRCDDLAGIKYLSNEGGWRTEMLKEGNRVATSMTDCVIMYSHDGINFRRDTNAFLSPTYEENSGWIYGDCYCSHGLVETVSDENPNVTELSFYTGIGYRTKNVSFVRFTVRLDGFYSLRADYSGGELLTRRMTVGDTLRINFSTSALGGVRIVICDEYANPIEGFDSGVLFGNSTDRNVDFAKPLSTLRGKSVRLKIYMNDADIYSVCSDI